MLFFKNSLPNYNALRKALSANYRLDETSCVQFLLNQLDFNAEIEQKIADLAKQFVLAVREKTAKKSGIEALMMHYDLSTEEGIMLMCLAEALLRIPDVETEKLLITDKLTSANWQEHIGRSESAFVNVATWGLALTGKVLDKSGQSNAEQTDFKTIWYGLLRRSGEPLIRKAVREAIKIMSHQFVIGRTIEEAFKASVKASGNYLYSFDMLGEVARTQEDADTYFKSYQHAVQVIGMQNQSTDIMRGPSISVKLSALYPRYEFSHRDLAVPVLIERLKTLALQAKAAGIGLTVDAEEADRLDMSLDIIEAVFADADLNDWEGLGLAVQAYQKRAVAVIDWLINLARQHQRRISVRLVKGAYWDTEIRLSQLGGYEGYPVFTRKVSTDVSYLVCAKRLLSAQDAIYPQFATHNAYSVAAILTLMRNDQNYQFEFQSLQGMGNELHNQLIAQGIPCRIYAPVGSHENLLPYLVRRLLENGANSSFVNQIADPKTPVEQLIASPVKRLQVYPIFPNPNIPLPKDIYGPGRLNSQGIDFSHYQTLMTLEKQMLAFRDQRWQAAPFNKSFTDLNRAQTIQDPSNRQRVVGHVQEATLEDLETALQAAQIALNEWDRVGVIERAKILEKIADLLEENRAELMMLTAREAGKNLYDGIAEVREAVDFCRYYAQMAKELMTPQELIGATGETNTLRLHGRGIILCISPWNFPIAIFTGQVVAALVTGNAVIAKPAEQTPLVAAKVIDLFYEAGVPQSVVQLLPGRGEIIGAQLVADARIDGVVFTGSTQTAKAIQQSLSARSGPIVPLIAETGGINALIADSTALIEQLTADVLTSAFGSAGQRCSALRVLFIQDDIADRFIHMLKGAMAELKVGDPLCLQTDLGPVIDQDAKQMLETHCEMMSQQAKLIYQVELPPATKEGTFFAPRAFELSDLSLLKKEVFGPVLHVIRYKREELDKVINDINDLGYGLTFGIQSRIDSTVDYIQKRIKVGNIYVNRNMIGAIVGVQPFGGHRLSGTGPKAGGPHYLSRFCVESTLTINTTAAGGNASLMALSSE